MRPSRCAGWRAALTMGAVLAVVLPAATFRLEARPPGTTGPGPDDGARRLIGRAFSATPLMSDLAELSDGIGGRPTGSAEMRRAVRWALEKFRAAGVDAVQAEPFQVPALWLPRTAGAACLSPEPFPIRVVGAPYAAGTPGGAPIEAKLVDAGSGSPDEIGRLGGVARGAVGLVSTGEMKGLADLFAELMRDPPMLRAAREAGLAGLLLMSTRPGTLLYRHPVSLNGTIVELPVALAARDHAGRLRRLMAAGAVTVRLAIDNEIGPAYEAHNVIAEIRGRERPDEIVLVGAHLDSWDLGTGALDDGINASMVIDLARGLRELGLAPRRTIRFALFSGEEQGLWGSAGYVRRHAEEMDRHVAAVVHDIGSGRITGFFLNGREELRGPVEKAMRAVAGLGPFLHPKEAVLGTDNFDFLLAGVPNLIAAQEATDYLPPYHSEQDVLERVDAHQARANLAVTSALIWALAEDPERPAPRQTRAQVERLLTETGVESQMRLFGMWDDWAAGRRGGPR